MIQGKVLVTGATGDTGRATVDELLARGHQVRALAHGHDERSKKLEERGVEVVYGDLLDIEQVRSALCGVQRAYFIYPVKPGIVQATAQFAQAAIEVGVDGIVNMSQKTARENAKSHAMKLHWLAERVFDWSGLNVAHIRPTLFAEWLLYVAPMIRNGLLHVPFGTGRHAPITAEDQARVIVGILEDPASHKGAMYPLFGPVEFTYEETAHLLTRLLGTKIEYKQVDFEEFTQTLQAGPKTSAKSQSSRTWSAKSERTTEQKVGDDFLFQHLRQVAIDHQNGVCAGTNDHVEKIGGRAPTTLEAFIDQHRAVFV
jgi:NAD(P)H dehydrogenase (quinone)